MFPSPFARKENFWTQINTDFQDLKTKYPCAFNGSNIMIPTHLCQLIGLGGFCIF